MKLLNENAKHIKSLYWKQQKFFVFRKYCGPLVPIKIIIGKNNASILFGLTFVLFSRNVFFSSKVCPIHAPQFIQAVLFSTFLVK